MPVPFHVIVCCVASRMLLQVYTASRHSVCWIASGSNRHSCVEQYTPECTARVEHERRTQPVLLLWTSLLWTMMRNLGLESCAGCRLLILCEKPANSDWSRQRQFTVLLCAPPRVAKLPVSRGTLQFWRSTIVLDAHARL